MGYRYNEWAPDGRFFFSVKGKVRSPSSIIKYDLETREEEVIYLSDEMITIYLSPDGKWLAFLGRGPERELMVVPSGGGAPRVVCRFRQTGGAPIHMTWTQDGRYILFFHRKPDVSKQGALGQSLYKVSVPEGKMEELDMTVIDPGYGLTVHPNGRDIMFSSLGFSFPYPEYWVMENFLPSEKKK